MYIEKLGNKCLECGSGVKPNNKKSISMHLSRTHEKINLEMYVLKHFYNNKIPLCECGCGGQVSWHVAKKEFNKFINGHNSQFTTSNQTSDSFKNNKKRITRDKSLKNLYKNNYENYCFNIILINLLSKFNFEDFFECKICGKLLSNNKKSIAGHLSHHKKSEVADFYPERFCKTKFKIKCKECNKLVANSNNVLARHLNFEHNIEWEDYILKWEHDGEVPMCNCGCGEKVSFGKGSGFREFIVGHNSRGENNPMYGLKGSKSPNFGKIRTDIMKEKYRQAAYERYESNPELIERVRAHTIERNAKGEFGCQTYKKHSVFNPFSQQEEWMDSSWEMMFLDLNINNKIACIKSHGIEISYFDPILKKERVYIPDFLVEKSKIVEIKAVTDATEMAKISAAEKWCKENSYEYEVLYYDKSLDKFLKMGWFKGIFGCTEYFRYGDTSILTWNGISLSSKNIEKISIEDRKVISSEIVGYYSKYGFPYPKLLEDSLTLEFEKLKNSSLTPEPGNLLPISKTTGNKIVYHFSPQIFSVSSPSHKSLVDAFLNENTLNQVIQNRLGITYKERFNITGAMIRQGFSSSRKAFMPSRFNTLVAKFLYEKYTSDGDFVLDFSTGFGQRFVGCISSNKNLTYIGCDPWSDNIKSIESMADFFNLKDKAILLNCGSEELNQYSELYNKASFAFSSPPYFNIEIYDNKNKSQAPTDSYDRFLCWWRDTVLNISLILKSNGILAFNMVNIIDSKQILNDMCSIIKEIGFLQIERFDLKLSRSHLHKNKSNFKFEPIIVFEKNNHAI